MLYLLYSALNILLLFYFGIGLALLICPWRRWVLLLAPTIGYCLITLVGWYCYRFTGAGTDAYARYCLIVPGGLLAAGLYRRYYRADLATSDSESLWRHELRAPILVAVLAFGLTSVPLLKSGEAPTSFAFTNNDIADSATIAAFLKAFPRDSQEGFLAQCDFCRAMSDRGIFGGSYSTAYAASVLGCDIYELQSLSLHVHFLLSVLIMYVVGRELLGFAHIGAVAVCLLYAVNPVMLFTVCQGYQGQILTTGVAMLIVLVHAQPMRATRLRDCWAFAPLAVLLNWGLSVTYPHMLLFAHAPLVPYAVMTAWRQRSAASILRAWCFGIAVFTTLLILSPLRAKSAYQYLREMGGVIAGWFIPWLSPDIFLGFHFGGTLERSLPTIYRIIASLALLGIAAWGLARLWRRNRDQFSMAASILFVVWAGYFYLAIANREGGQLGGYKSYKLLSYFLPLVLLAFWSVFHDVNNWRTLLRSPALVAMMAALLTVNLVSDRVMLQRYSIRHVSPALADIEQLRERSDIRAVNVCEPNDWDSLWQTSCLLDKRLYFGRTTYAGRAAGPYEAPWDLLRIESNRAAPQYYFELVRGRKEFVGLAQSIKINSLYELAPRRPWNKQATFPLTVNALDIANGWKRIDGDHVAFEPSQAGATLVVEVSEVTPVQLRLVFRKPPRQPGFAIVLNYKPVEFIDNPEFCRVDLLLTTGTNRLELRPSQSPEPRHQATPAATEYVFSVVELAAPEARQSLARQRTETPH